MSMRFRFSYLFCNRENLKYSIEMLANIRKQPDAKEGIQAFFEKRKPNWN